jgi:hypothetical protein
VIVSVELKKDRSLTSHKKIDYVFPKGIMRKVERTFFKYKLISRAIDFDPYDIVVLRYPRVDDLACRGFYESLGHKIITEHHTNEVFQLLHSWKLDPSFLLRFILENKNASPMLSRVAGLIGVTDEIRKLELEKSGPKPSAVISNGISTDDVEFTSFTPYDGKKLKMICIVSAFAPWHGLERLLSGLRLYSGSVHVAVCLLGNIGSVYLKEIKKIHNPHVTIKMPGMKYGAELSKYFYESTIAVSSLALYKNRMNEACVLKSREYVARGIPFIYAYNDPDIPDDCRFALKLPNNGTPVDLNKVIDFAGTVAQFTFSHCDPLNPAFGGSISVGTHGPILARAGGRSPV